MYYDFDPLALSAGAVDELARDVARDFSLEAAEDVQRFQQRADRVFIETRVEALKRLRRIRNWWVLSAGLLSFAVWPLGWMSMVAGALAITVAYVVGFGEHHVHELLGYASTNAVQAKQDYFMLSRLQKARGGAIRADRGNSEPTSSNRGVRYASGDRRGHPASVGASRPAVPPFLESSPAASRSARGPDLRRPDGRRRGRPNSPASRPAFEPDRGVR